MCIFQFLFSDENVCHIIRDLFVAGTENVSIALQWLMAFMVNYPEVQDRCRDTIKDVSYFVHEYANKLFHLTTMQLPA